MRAPFQILAIPYRIVDGTPMYCVFHRADHDQWQFIAGGGEDNETPLAAAKRETFEEGGVHSTQWLGLKSLSYIPVTIISEMRRKHWDSSTYVIPEYTFGFECQDDVRLSPEHTDCVWNSVEKIEKAKNSQLAREIEIALPVELDREKQIQLVREYVKENFVSVGMCADFAIHDKQDGNPHAHIMLTMRPLEQSGEWGAKSKKEYLLDKGGQRIKLKNGTFKSRKVDTVDWNSQEKAEVWRQAWADTANRYLAAQDRPERIDHRSYKRQGIEQIPTVHMGVAATQMERRGIVTDKGNQNREIREQNRLLKEVKRRIAALTAWIKEKTAQTKENPFLSVPILSERSEQPSTLLELLNRAYTEAAKPQSRYEKIQDLKLYAKAFNFLQSRNITTLVQLQEVVSDMKKQYWTTNGEIKQTEKLLHERKELIDQAEKYREHRPTYKAYMQTKPKKQEDFFESNRVALTLYQSAERFSPVKSERVKRR